MSDLIDSFKREYPEFRAIFSKKMPAQGSSFRSFGFCVVVVSLTVIFSKPLRVSNHISLVVVANNLQEKRKDALRRSSQSIALARRWDP